MIDIEQLKRRTELITRLDEVIAAGEKLNQLLDNAGKYMEQHCAPLQGTPDQNGVEADGCPTEKAVLQRHWREHTAMIKQLQAENDRLMRARNRIRRDSYEDF